MSSARALGITVTIAAGQSDDWRPYPEEGPSELIGQLHDYWHARRGGTDRVPSRDDIRTEHIEPLLPFVWLLDFDRGTRDFRCRLIGPAVVDGVGRDCTGRTLAEVHGDARLHSRAVRPLLDMMDDARPRWRQGPPLLVHDATDLWLESLILPLAADHRTPDQVLGMTLFLASGRRNHRPVALRVV
jgi:hypothetical protein